MNLFLKILFIVLFIVNFIEHKSHRYRKNKLERDFRSHEASSFTIYYRGQQDTSYYQPANYNQRQQYFYDKTTKQVPYRTDYDREQIKIHGNINCQIPTPDIKGAIYPIW